MSGPTTRMKRASYRDAVKWIAYNDEPGTDPPDHPDAERNASEYVTSCLIADLFGVPPERVGRDVIRERRKGIPEA